MLLVTHNVLSGLIVEESIFFCLPSCCNSPGIARIAPNGLRLWTAWIRLQLVVIDLVVQKDDLLLLEVEHQHVAERTLVGADALLQRSEADAVVDGHAERLYAVLDDGHLGRLGQLRLLHLDVPQLARLVHELAEVLVLA